MIRALLLVLALAVAAPATAHEIRPAYLEIVETAAGQYQVTWKQPAQTDGVLALEPQWPSGCTGGADRTRELAPGALISRWKLECPGGLSGAIRISGLDRTLTSAFVRLQRLDGKVLEGAVDNGHPDFDVSAARPPAAASYFRLGVEHILLGFDHLAFVAGLMLLIRRSLPLAWALTAFTVAHSLTLAAVMFGVAGLPSRAVELFVAMSIVMVALEAVRAIHGQSGLTARLPWLVAFAFGLLHGFGFAGALSEIGLPEGARISALLLFNLGVEAGQFTVVGLLLAAARLLGPALARRRIQAERAAAYALGGMGVYWTLERLVG